MACDNCGAGGQRKGLRLEPVEPVTKNKTLNETAEGFILQNAGEATVKIGSWWTIFPKQSLSFGGDGEGPYFLDVSVKFSGTGEKRLEIMKMVTKDVIH